MRYQSNKIFQKPSRHFIYEYALNEFFLFKDNEKSIRIDFILTYRAILRRKKIFLHDLQKNVRHHNWG